MNNIPEPPAYPLLPELPKGVIFFYFMEQIAFFASRRLLAIQYIMTISDIPVFYDFHEDKYGFYTHSEEFFKYNKSLENILTKRQFSALSVFYSLLPPIMEALEEDNLPRLPCEGDRCFNLFQPLHRICLDCVESTGFALKCFENWYNKMTIESLANRTVGEFTSENYKKKLQWAIENGF